MIPSSTEPSGLHRVFIGIGCDSYTQEQIGELMKPLKKEFPRIRWVAEVNLHLTLAFLGDISTTRLESLMTGFDDAYHQESCFHYQLKKVCRFPNSAGHVVAIVGDPDDYLNRIYQSTLVLLQGNHLEPAWDEFLPHITLGRIKKSRPAMTRINQHANVLLDVTKVTLYQSILTASGSVYTRLHETQLRQHK